jgi:putative glycosyltransferase (TIGR04348 family)
MGVKPTICLITPALKAANNGNWQTASRWARMLSADYRMRLLPEWDGAAGDDAMIALHARRSAASIGAWSRQLVRRPLVLALTGTDLYRDIAVDTAAQRSLALADRLIVLHELAPADLPREHRHKAVVSFQSCSAWAPFEAKAERHLRAVMVGHLREEKDPRTYFAAARWLADKGRSDILLDHIGAPLDAALGREAEALQRDLPAYRWLGARDHREVRARIRRAHVLVHCSRMEGGAHVVMEALRSGTPVIASRIAGNVGMLGRDWAGLFKPGDAQGLARLLLRARDDPAMLAGLQTQGQARAPLFEPERERGVLRQLMKDLLS